MSLAWDYETERRTRRLSQSQAIVWNWWKVGAIMVGAGMLGLGILLCKGAL